MRAPKKLVQVRNKAMSNGQNPGWVYLDNLEKEWLLARGQLPDAPDIMERPVQITYAAYNDMTYRKNHPQAAKMQDSVQVMFARRRNRYIVAWLATVVVSWLFFFGLACLFGATPWHAAVIITAVYVFIGVVVGLIFGAHVVFRWASNGSRR